MTQRIKKLRQLLNKVRASRDKEDEKRAYIETFDAESKQRLVTMGLLNDMGEQLALLLDEAEQRESQDAFNSLQSLCAHTERENAELRSKL